MSEREQIAKRHGLPPRAAAGLVGETPEELEADAAAKTALIGMFSPHDPEAPPPPVPPVQGMPPRDKQVADYTPEEWAAVEENTKRTMREREREEKQERERQEAEANRTEEQRFGDSVSSLLAPGVKQEQHAAIVRAIHGSEEREQ
jgi:hypothetical protein